MKRLLCFLLVASFASAQTQGNLPDMTDSMVSQTIGAGANQIALPEGVNTGELIYACIAYDYQTAGSTGPFAVTDTQGNTYTLTSLALTPNLGHNQGALYAAYTIAGSTGADTLTAALPGGNYSMTVGRFAGVSSTLDGTPATATQAAAGVQTVSTTQTTSTHGSVGISCTAGDTYSGGGDGQGTDEYVSNNFCSNSGCAVQVFETMKHTGLAGSQTMTNNTSATAAFGSNATFVKQTLFFKPTSTIKIVDTVMPDCAVGVICPMQLHEVGGTGSLTYSITSGALPTGLSLTASTGAITGTPSGAPGTSSVSFQVTDGIVTSSPVSLPITVKSAFLTPSVQEQRHANNELFAGSNAVTFSQSVICGQVIEVSFFGQDTHAINGFVNATSGINNFVTDSLGTVFHRVGPISGSYSAPLVTWVGQAITSGPDTVSIGENTTSSGLNWTATVLNNVQPVLDRGTFAASSWGGTSVVSSFTSIVPNTLVTAATNDSNNANGGFDVNLTYTGMPLAVADYGVASSAGAGTTLVASPSTTNLTASFTSTNQGTIVNTGMFGFRPAATYTGGCAVSLQGLNEKPRRIRW